MFNFLKRMILASLFVALLSPCSFAAVPKEAQKPASSPPSEIVLVRVNGKTITKEGLDTATNNVLPQLAFHSFVSEDKLKSVRKQTLENLINNELIYKLYKDAALDIKEKEIDAKVEELKKRLPPGENFDEVLKRSKITLRELKEDIKAGIIVERASKKKAEEVKKKAEDTVTEAFMKEYFQKNLKKFMEPEQVHLRSILVKADPSGGQRVWAESLKKAQEIAKTAKSGQDFPKLAEKVSEDPFAKNGGDMGWAHKGSLFPEIEEAVSKMKVNEVSDPIMTLYGYHIVKLEGKKPSVQRKFEEINKAKLKKELEEKEYKKVWKEWIAELRSTAKIEYVQEDKP